MLRASCGAAAGRKRIRHTQMERTTHTQGERQDAPLSVLGDHHECGQLTAGGRRTHGATGLSLLVQHMAALLLLPLMLPKVNSQQDQQPGQPPLLPSTPPSQLPAQPVSASSATGRHAPACAWLSAA
jgi:hypothetical protein